MDEKCGYKTPTSADSLEQQIIDPSFPKNEREWWASAEITRLRAEVEALRADAEAKRGLLLWALYHHQGASSGVGQPIRKALGIGQHDPMTPEQIREAARAAQEQKR